jgi:CubicO group peptidase (beta-lactamase class C family)
VHAARVLEARFETLSRAARIPGLAAVVLRDTTVLLARGYGFADLERGVPMTVETPSNIASVSKPISAIVALRLVESGRLDLDAPLRPTVDFIEFCESVRGEGGTFFADFACDDSTLSMRHVLSMAANGKPGTRFFYNPPAYSWMSRAIAEAAGVGFSDLVDSLVLRPAGMAHSARVFRKRPLPAALAEVLALPYHVDSTGAVVRSDPPPPQGDGAAGGVIASAMDLARLDRALMSGRLISAADVDALPHRKWNRLAIRPRLVHRRPQRPASGVAHRALGRLLLGTLLEGARRRADAHPARQLGSPEVAGPAR